MGYSGEHRRAEWDCSSRHANLFISTAWMTIHISMQLITGQSRSFASCLDQPEILTHSPRASLLTTREAAWYIISVAYVCLSVSLSVMRNFQKPWRRKFFLVLRYILTEYGSSSYIKVIGSSSRSRSKKSRKSLSLQCKTLIGNNSGDPRGLRVAMGVDHGGGTGGTSPPRIWSGGR